MLFASESLCGMWRLAASQTSLRSRFQIDVEERAVIVVLATSRPTESGRFPKGPFYNRRLSKASKMAARRSALRLLCPVKPVSVLHNHPLAMVGPARETEMHHKIQHRVIRWHAGSRAPAEIPQEEMFYYTQRCERLQICTSRLLLAKSKG